MVSLVGVLQGASAVTTDFTLKASVGRKSGSRMKIQDRYRQGLIAACLSQRRTVEAETGPARARAATSRTNYGHDHRAGGAWDWDSAGHW
ncbi:hypothetical protein SAZ_04045 [Streptomyces noursei ZPM]|nr:hypothetical protein SAZ_04045 [Streptomyces noursei ZPM]EXU85622.1 hypothetical protein P354_08215 [Streptomyces noursei PD-1]